METGSPITENTHFLVRKEYAQLRMLKLVFPPFDLLTRFYFNFSTFGSVALKLGIERNGNRYNWGSCGGVLFASDLVLTAAHCACKYIIRVLDS